jgi:hypothetical protein
LGEREKLSEEEAKVGEYFPPINNNASGREIFGGFSAFAANFSLSIRAFLPVAGRCVASEVFICVPSSRCIISK